MSLLRPGVIKRHKPNQIHLKNANRQFELDALVTRHLAAPAENREL